MSQSRKILKELGAVVLTNTNIKTGSTSAVTPKATPAPTSLADAAVTLTVAQLQTGILTMTPTAGRNVTLPTAANMAAVLTTVGDTLDFNVINLGADTVHLTVVSPSTAIIGAAVVRDADPTADAASGSAVFRVRMTNVGSGTEAYSTYRLA